MEIYLLVAILVLVYLVGVLCFEHMIQYRVSLLDDIAAVFWPAIILMAVLATLIETLAYPFIKAWNGLKAFDQWLIRKVWGF